MRRRVVIAVGGIVAVAALVMVGGWPDPGRSLDLLTGRGVTAATETALVTMLCWLAALVLAVGAVRGVSRQPQGTPWSRRTRSLVALIIGVALLGIGLARHDGYRVCCATPTTAQEANQLVH